MKQFSTLLGIAAVALAGSFDAGAQFLLPQNPTEAWCPGLVETMALPVRTAPSPLSNPLEVKDPDAPDVFAVMRKASGVNICGNVVFSETDANDIRKRPAGIWSFTPQAEFSLVTPKVTAGGYGAAMIDDTYYACWYLEVFGIKLPLYMVFDTKNDWEEADYGVDYAQTCYAMTTDGAMVYGAFLSDDGKSLVFGKMDPQNWKRFAVAPLTTNWNACAIDNDNTLYAIDTKGDFLKVDVYSGSITRVGPTGFVPKYLTGATIDKASGRMFWTVSNDTDGDFLAEIDKTTGKATKLCDFPNHEEIVGLYVPYVPAPGAPAKAENLTVSFPDGDLTGNVSFTVPANLYGGAPGIGEVDYRLKFNGCYVGSSRAKAPYGSTQTISGISVGQYGYYTVAVELSNEAGCAEVAHGSYWLGLDNPKAPENVSASYADGSFTVTWDPVTESVHGGYCDPNTVSYDVYMLPDSVKVASTTATTARHTFAEPSKYEVYEFCVVAKNASMESKLAYSNQVGIGGQAAPYSETFDSADALKDYIIINANEDRYTWEYYASKKAVRYNYNFSADADDWLVTPGLKLEGGKVYLVSFGSYNAYGTKTEKLEVKLGTAPAPEAMTVVVADTLDITSKDETKFDSYVYVPESGVYFLGFHAVSPKAGSYLYLDNISVSAPIDGGVPAAPTDIAVTPDPNGERKAEISVKLPALALNGSQLQGEVTLKVDRGGELIETLTGTPGQTLTFSDEVQKSAEYTYTFSPSNDKGDGQPADTTLLVGMDWAKPITDVTIAEISDGVVKIDWTNPTEDLMGHDLKGRYYTQVRLWNGDTNPWIDREVYGETLTFTAVEPADPQLYVQYMLYPTTDRGGKGPAYTEMIPVGVPYKLPFAEAFANGGLTHDMHSDSFGASTSSWSTKKNNGVKGVNAQNDDNGYAALTAYSNEAAARLKTVKIDLREAKSPELSVYTMSFAPKAADAVDNNRLEIHVCEYDKADEWTVVGGGEIYTLCGEKNNEWTEVKADLSAFKGKVVIVALAAIIANKELSVVADNLNIVDTAQVLIPETIADGDRAVIRSEAGAIVVENAEGLNVAVYDVAGNTLHSRMAGADAVRVSVQPGCYIVAAGTSTAKIIVR